MPTILELRHAECESPGAYAAGLADVADIHTVRAWREPIPHDPTSYAAIIVMGGPMGADDGPRLPWIDDEIDLLRRASASDTPIWAVCLGSQLLAAALGSEISTGPAPEIGLLDVSLTVDGRRDPVWSSHPDPVVEVLQWHFDTFSLPPGAVRLASSPAYPNQLFRHGHSYGIQFHLEVGSAQLAEWLDVPEYRAELDTVLGPGGVERVVADVARAESVTHPLAVTAIRRWFDLTVSGDAGGLR